VVVRFWVFYLVSFGISLILMIELEGLVRWVSSVVVYLDFVFMFRICWFGCMLSRCNIVLMVWGWEFVWLWLIWIGLLKLVWDCEFFGRKFWWGMECRVLVMIFIILFNYVCGVVVGGLVWVC